MSDASAMVERCGRHQHPELFGGREVDPTCSLSTAREIALMTCDRAPVETPAPRDPTRDDWYLTVRWADA